MPEQLIGTVWQKASSWGGDGAIIESSETLQRMRQYFDGRAPAWDERSPLHREAIQRILGLFSIPASCKILDVACGTGVLFDALCGLSPRQVLAVDISPAMVRIAAQKAAGTCIRVLACDFYTLAEAGFDLAIVYNAYPHFMDKNGFAQTARRVLAPGGRLVVAHGVGRRVINGRHSRQDVSPLSTPLRGCPAEAAEWEDSLLRVDTMVDLDHMYVLSATSPL